MISFTCPSCGELLRASEELAGRETSCASCGTSTLVPIDLDCEGTIVAPYAKTITLEELQSLRKNLERA
jgi:hypothetical protein